MPVGTLNAIVAVDTAGAVVVHVVYVWILLMLFLSLWCYRPS